MQASAERRLVRAMVPQVGANKVRFGGQAAKIAPDLLRDPELRGWTREGLQTHMERRFAEAAAKLDAAADQRLVSQQIPIAPLLRQIDAEIAGVTAHPLEASAFPKAFTKAGDVTPAAIGRAVEPAPRHAQLATLRTIRSELDQLGPVAAYESVRRIRAAWDDVAKVKYVPSSAQDLLRTQGEATGASKGAGAMRQGLAAGDPASATANAQFSLYKSARDVMRAAEEQERVRPTVGRSMMAGAAGGLMGSGLGASAAGVGIVVGPMVERAIAAGPSLQIVMAKRLAMAAEALRGGRVAHAQAILGSTARKFPTLRRGIRIAGRATPAAAQTAQERRERDRAN